jgi:hypothetical protein
VVKLSDEAAEVARQLGDLEGVAEGIGFQAGVALRRGDSEPPCAPPLTRPSSSSNSAGR